eukprot:scaffold342495_cov31-Attheya_sp.AAC.1
MELVITLRDMAEREETKIAQTSRIAIAATSRTGPTIPTFMAHSGLHQPPASSGQYHTIGYAAYDLPDPPIRNTDAGIAVSVFLSNAEMALREAS